jgi:hypothetical protein
LPLYLQEKDTTAAEHEEVVRKMHSHCVALKARNDKLTALMASNKVPIGIWSTLCLDPITRCLLRNVEAASFDASKSLVHTVVHPSTRKWALKHLAVLKH